jgi:hypothetical protein
MGIQNHFWPRSKKKVFKIGRKSAGASAVILTLGWFSAVSAQCQVEFQKNKFHQHVPWNIPGLWL